MEQTKQAYDALSDFLAKNESKPMRVGIHAYNVCCEIVFTEWEIQDDGMEIYISDSMNNVCVYDGNEEEIESYTTDPLYMNIFPERGDFELQTAHAAICIMFI